MLLFRSLPGPCGPVARCSEPSRSFTAAGLSGICTRFPFHPSSTPGKESTKPAAKITLLSEKPPESADYFHQPPPESAGKGIPFRFALPATQYCQLFFILKSDLQPRRGRKRKNRNAKALTNNALAFLKSTRSRDRTGTAITGHRILSPACLPIPPSEQPPFVRKAGQKYELIFYSARKRTVLVRLDAGGSASDSGDGRGNRKPYHPL